VELQNRKINRIGLFR